MLSSEKYFDKQKGFYKESNDYYKDENNNERKILYTTLDKECDNCNQISGLQDNKKNDVFNLILCKDYFLEQIQHKKNTITPELYLKLYKYSKDNIMPEN